MRFQKVGGRIEAARPNRSFDLAVLGSRLAIRHVAKEGTFVPLGDVARRRELGEKPLIGCEPGDRLVPSTVGEDEPVNIIASGIACAAGCAEAPPHLCGEDDSVAQCCTFERGEDLIDLSDLVLTKIADKKPATRMMSQQSFALELKKSFPHRGPADSQPFGNDPLYQTLAWCQAASDDEVAKSGRRSAR